MISVQAEAGSRSSGIVSTIGTYRKFSRVGNGTTATNSMLFNDAAEGEIQLRLAPSWTLDLTGGSSMDQTYNYVGLGFRASMPGFFLLGSEGNSYGKRQRSRKVETFLHTGMFKVTDRIDATLPISYYSPRGGFTADILLSRNSDAFVSVDLSLQVLRGDIYVSYGLGLGYEF